MFSIIVAHDSKNVIGRDEGIPWNCPADMRYFAHMTTGHIVIMGRNTYRSIGDKPLANRVNIVISSTLKREDAGDVIIARDIGKCVDWCTANRKDRKCFVIGGAQIYNAFLAADLVNEMFVSEIYTTDHQTCYTGDELLFFDYTNDRRWVLTEQNFTDETFSKSRLVFRNREEEQMITLMEDILEQGNSKSDRTGVGTLSLFGKQLTFNLRNGRFPLMTTRRLSLRMIFEELMWNLRGQTDAQILNAKRVPIWNGNSSDEFLASRGLSHYRAGDIGHAYGMSWRHFGGDYRGCDRIEHSGGFDQLAYIIDELKNNKDSRRHLVSLWEPNKMDQAALPPCLYSFQFYVADGYLSLMMTQRSSDYVVAGGWNVAYGALLVYLLAYHCGLKPDKLIWNIGDVHIYNNVKEAAQTQIKRTPRVYPKLVIVNPPADLLKFEYENIKLVNYAPHSAIKTVMNV